MVDTVKIPRPKFHRTKKAGGRVEHDSRGNAIWRRSRAEDAADLTVPAELAMVDDSTAAAEAAHAIVQGHNGRHGESAG